MKSHNFAAGICLGIAALAATNVAVIAAVSFDSATVTRVENKVSIGEIKGGQASARRPAAVSEVVKANNFIQTASGSRAELQFKDKSLVRVGQNSIFSFEAKSRTLSLEQGDMLFYVAPGNGGGTIKTPALTAAITGTLCKVARDMIVALRGSVTIDVGGKPVKIPAGFAVKVMDGRAHVFKYDPREAVKGKLYAMGPLPEDPGIQVKKQDHGIHFQDWLAMDPRQVNPAFNRPQQVVQVVASRNAPPIQQPIQQPTISQQPIIAPMPPPVVESLTTTISWRGRVFDVPTYLVTRYVTIGATIPPR